MDAVLRTYLEHILGKGSVEMNVPMSKKTTWHVGGVAKFFVTPKSKTDLARLVSALDYIEYPYKIIGAGSNLLVNDKGFDGVIIRLAFSDIVENGNFIYADAGASLISVVKRATELGLGGLEFACGIPGTVGGAIFGNAGAHGSDISNVVTLVDVLCGGEVVTLDSKQCKFGYRTSVFRGGSGGNAPIILGAYFYLLPTKKEVILNKITEYTQKRIANQPTGFNAGSVFRNPAGQSAGALIDKLGLKGTKIGGAMISDKHANFIINTGNATARDIEKLIKLIKKRVFEEYKIKLQTEIQRI